MGDVNPQIRWIDGEGIESHACWRSLAGHAPPRRVEVVDDSLSADQAWALARAGTGLLWCGDFQNARHLLQALGRRVDAHARRGARAAASLREAFLAQRQAQAERTRVLGLLLLPFDADHGVPLRRAPDVRQAGLEARGPVAEHYVASLRELLGLIGAHEWRKKGVEIAALQARIHPHHGVFSPLRGEYVDLVARAPLPAGVKPGVRRDVAGEAIGDVTGGVKGAALHGATGGEKVDTNARGTAFDIGAGTGVLAAVLAQRGVEHVVATDADPRALACARDNLARLGLTHNVQVQQADLFPAGRAALVVCNPPWVPAPASSPLEAAVYDPDSRMLRGFLAGLAVHLAPGGEGWLILSDLAEHLGLRSRDELLGWIAAAGLHVLGRIDTRPRHARVADASDPLHAARAAEVTSLWRLAAI